MSNKGMAAIGNRLGTGNVIVLDDSVCPVAFMANLQQFFARESCGWCAPCRDGLPWAEQILRAVDAGEGRRKDIEVLHELTDDLGPGRTFCGLAPGAMASLKSGLACFAEDFAAHLAGGCAWT